MSGLLSINITEARGQVAISAEVDHLGVAVGCMSGLTGLSGFYLSAQSAVAAVGYGDAVDTGCQCIEQRQTSGTGRKYPAAFYGTGTGTEGSYGPVNLTAKTGTAVVGVDAATHPRGTFEARLKIVGGGTVGTAGITYQTSLDAGRTYGPLTRLGVAASIAVPNAGVTFTLDPPAAALVTSVNALRTAAIAHFTDVTGTPHVHASSDTTDAAALTAVSAATNDATAIVVFNACLALLETHVASAVYHTHADTVAEAALAAITNAVTAEDVVARLPSLIAAYNAHIILVGSGPVHGSTGGAHTCGLSTASGGTLLAGDVVAVRTYAPAPGTSDIDAAFVALSKSTFPGALVFCEWPLTRSDAEHISTGLDAMQARGKRCTVVGRTRLPNVDLAAEVTNATNATPIVITTSSAHGLTDQRQYTIAGVTGNTAANGSFTVTVIDATSFSIAATGTGGYSAGGVVTESEADWAANVAEDFLGFDDSRVHIRATYGLLTDATTTRQYLRSDAAQFCADVVRTARVTWPCAPADQPVANFTLVDANGALVGHDEGPLGNVTGLSNDDLGNRFGCNQRIANSVGINNVYNTVPWVMYATDERVRNLMVRRIVSAIERVTVQIGVPILGGNLAYTPADPSTPGSQPKLTPQAVAAIQGALYRGLSQTFASDIQNASDASLNTGLVQVNPIVTVTGGNLLAISPTIAPRVFGYVLELNPVIAVAQ